MATVTERETTNNNYPKYYSFLMRFGCSGKMSQVYINPNVWRTGMNV